MLHAIALAKHVMLGCFKVQSPRARMQAERYRACYGWNDKVQQSAALHRLSLEPGLEFLELC